MQATSEKMLFQSENYQYVEQLASQCRGGFLHQLLQEMTGRLEEGCGTISDAYIHYYYKLNLWRRPGDPWPPPSAALITG